MSPLFRIIPGGITTPQGFLASGVQAGIKKLGGRDIALIVSQKPCHSAGTFTTNSVKAAPLDVDLAKVRHPISGIVINSGNANACTGKQGVRNANQMCEIARKAVASRSSERISDFLVCSTGRIGIQLPMQKIEKGIKMAAASLAKNSQTAAEAIMTTDTFAKKMAVELSIGGRRVRIGGIAKGAGMIQPGMSQTGTRPSLHATMLCFITTDAAIHPSTLQQCLNKAVARSFNRITVDGDMSTNDTVLLLANGMASNRPLRQESQDLRRFQTALDHVALSLALMIVQDGEGISKVVTLKITGAATAAEAETAVRAIGTSTLVKCSWCGEDPNWGRILAAVGYSGVRFNYYLFSIKYNDIFLVKNGLEMSNNFNKVCRIIKSPSFLIQCSLGMGKHQATLYSTDLTEKYVELNKGE